MNQPDTTISFDLQAIVEETREKTNLMMDRFLMEWYEEEMRKCTIPMWRNHFATKADCRRNDLIIAVEPRALREKFLTENPEEAHVYESTRFDD